MHVLFLLNIDKNNIYSEEYLRKCEQEKCIQLPHSPLQTYSFLPVIS